jgi:RNA polymerase sigma-70 factor (ECF subfamily)
MINYVPRILITQKNLSTDNFVNHFEDSSKPVDKMDTYWLQDFVKRLKPKCIQIIDLLFFKGYTNKKLQMNWTLRTVKTQNRNCINDLRNYLKV